MSSQQASQYLFLLARIRNSELKPHLGVGPQMVACLKTSPPLLHCREVLQADLAT